MRLRTILTAFATIVVGLPLSAAITGTVISSDGQAVTGAKISLFAPETAEAIRVRVMSKTAAKTPLATVTSDARGNFSIDSPKDQPVVDLRVESAGFSPDGTRALPDEELGALVLFPATMQTGTITAGGKPVAGARVIFSGTAEYDATTDEKGHYSAPDPLKWANRLVIIHPDYAILAESLGGPFGGARKGLDRTLEAGVTLSGHAFAADGTTPVANASIVIDGWPLAMSAADGSFRVAHAPKNWATVEARLDDRVGARAHASGDVAIKLAKAATIAGVVLDAKSNMPLAGVEVRLFSGGNAFAPITVEQRSAFTNAKGAYTLAGVSPGAYQLNPKRPGYVTPNVSLSVTAGQAAQKTLYATARGRVLGTVTDDQKRPVAGARVAARAAAREAGFMMMGLRNFGQEGASYTTPDGRFVLRSVATDADLQIDASKKGFPSAHSATLKLAPAERKAGVAITIPRGVALTGKVVDRDGRPISGVAVEAIEATNESGFGGARRMIIGLMQSDRNDELVRTGSDGTYTMRVKEGTYDVVFKREGFSAKSARGVQISATTKPLDVTLEPGVAITGRVSRGGAGVEGVNVMAMGNEGSANAVSGPDGAFRLDDLTPGSMTLIANKRDEFIQEMRPVTAPAQNVEIQVRPGGKVSGHVVDKSSHKPVTSFQAGISTSRSGGGMLIQTPPILKSFTTDDGSFTLENVPSGQMQVVVSAPGYTTARMSGINIEEAKPIEDMQIELDTGVKLTGRVTGPDGAPLSGVGVRQDVSGPARMLAGMGGMESSAVTDPNGEYTIETLEPGEKTFTFFRQGYLSESRTVTLSGTSSRLDVQLSTGVHLTGVVMGEAGGPVADAVVTASSASDSGFGGRQARTDASGNFQIDGLAPGHYQVTATKSGFSNGILRDFDVASGAPARIIMKSGGTIIGHVTGLTPQELENATVQAFGSNGGSSAPVDSTGNFKIEGAPTGTVRVSARTGGMLGGSGKSSPQKSVQVDPGASVTVDLEFKSGTVVRGRVTRDGQAMASAGVAFFPRGGGAATNASTTTDSSGNYEVSGLEDATYNVQIIDFQRTAPFTTSYEVKGSGTFDIDIKPATLRGRVIDATTGEPLANARVEMHASSTDAILSSRAAATDANGAFVLDNIARGNYEVKADREGYGHDIKSVVVGDAPEDLEFKLSPSNGVTITVVDARDNRTLAANVIRVTDAQGRVVDTSGMFRFGGGPEPVKLTLSPGSYTVTLAAMGYATQTVRVVSPSNPTVRMSPGGTLAIQSKSNTMLRARLIDSNGAAYVRGYGPAAGTFTIDPAPGVTTIQNVAPGSYRLQILGAGDQVAKTVPVTVIDGQQSVVEVD